jgi:plasmid maintenance system antidote protein VapI
MGTSSLVPGTLSLDNPYKTVYAYGNNQGAVMSKSLPQTPRTILKAPMDEYQLNPIKMANDIGLSRSGFRHTVIDMTKAIIPAALRLAKHFGATPNYWLNLQTQSNLAEATKDSELTAILKGTPRAKKTTTTPRHYGCTQFW